MWLWAGFIVGAAAAAPAVLAPARLRPPAAAARRSFHPEWVGERIEKLTAALARFREQPGGAGRLLRAARSSCRRCWSAFYFAVVYALHMPITFWDLAVIVPISFVVQMLPVSVNGFGVREATFSFYFTRLGLPISRRCSCRWWRPA